jgi:hypothetical protein
MDTKSVSESLVAGKLAAGQSEQWVRVHALALPQDAAWEQRGAAPKPFVLEDIRETCRKLQTRIL